MPAALEPMPPGTSPVLRTGDNAVAYHIPIAPSSNNVATVKTTIALPRRSSWTSGLHFHATHTEYLCLVKGSIFVELDGEVRLFSASKGGEIDKCTSDLVHKGLVIEVPRYARHDWGRLEHYVNSFPNLKLGRGMSAQTTWPEDWTDEVVVEEWTDPVDIQKPLFFWNLNNIITESSELVLSRRQQIAKGVLGGWWIDLQLFVVFWELDNWPVFFDLRYRDMPFRGSRGIFPSITNALEIVTSLIILFFARIIGQLLGLRGVEQRRTPDALWKAYLKPTHSL